MDPWVGIPRTTGLRHPQRVGGVVPDSGVGPCVLRDFWCVTVPSGYQFPSLGRNMDELGAFSGAPGILGPWQAMVRGLRANGPLPPEQLRVPVWSGAAGNSD